MNLRPLVIDDKAKADAASVRSLAEQDSNHYRPDRPGAKIPGDDSRFVAHFGTYRAVFSLTHADGLVYRHLSVSVPGGKYANPVAVFHIAELFGFAGYEGGEFPPADWLTTVSEDERCIVVAQPLAADAPKEKLS